MSVDKVSSFSAFLPTFDIIGPFDYAILDTHSDISHCGCNFHFLMTNDVGYLFFVLISNLYIFDEMSRNSGHKCFIKYK